MTFAAKFTKVPAQPGETYTLAGREYPVTARCCTDEGDSIPLVDIQWMSDERWEQTCRESAIKHLQRAGIEPTDEHIDAYHAFLNTDQAGCGGELFNGRMRKAVLA